MEDKKLEQLKKKITSFISFLYQSGNEVAKLDEYHKHDTLYKPEIEEEIKNFFSQIDSLIYYYEELKDSNIARDFLKKSYPKTEEAINKIIYFIIFKEINGDFQFFNCINSGVYNDLAVIFEDRNKAVIRKDLLLREYADIEKLKIVRTSAKEIFNLTKGKIYAPLSFKLEEQQKAIKLIQLQDELEDCISEQSKTKVSKQTVEKLSKLIEKENDLRLEILKLEAEIHGGNDDGN